MSNMILAYAVLIVPSAVLAWLAQSLARLFGAADPGSRLLTTALGASLTVLSLGGLYVVLGMAYGGGSQMPVGIVLAAMAAPAVFVVLAVVILCLLTLAANNVAVADRLGREPTSAGGNRLAVLGLLAIVAAGVYLGWKVKESRATQALARSPATPAAQLAALAGGAVRRDDFALMRAIRDNPNVTGEVLEVIAAPCLAADFSYRCLDLLRSIARRPACPERLRRAIASYRARQERK